MPVENLHIPRQDNLVDCWQKMRWKLEIDCRFHEKKKKKKPINISSIIKADLYVHSCHIFLISYYYYVW